MFHILMIFATHNVILNTVICIQNIVGKCRNETFVGLQPKARSGSCVERDCFHIRGFCSWTKVMSVFDLSNPYISVEFLQVLAVLFLCSLKGQHIVEATSLHLSQNSCLGCISKNLFMEYFTTKRKCAYNWHIDSP